jgi:hypothetical protein
MKSKGNVGKEDGQGKLGRKKVTRIEVGNQER